MGRDIVDEIRKDRENGAKRLESEYKAGLMAFAKRFCADDAEAEALVYRTFAEVVAGIDSYTEKSAFFGWMCKILINCHANDIRRRSNQDTVYVETVPEMPDDGASRVVEAIDANILREAVESLPPEMKETVLLRYFMDMPILKVAQILSQPVGTVKSRLYYARVLLGQRLGAKLKKPGVALIAAAFLLLGATAAVVGIRYVAVDNQDEAAEVAMGATSAMSASYDSLESFSPVPQVSPVSSVTQVSSGGNLSSTIYQLSTLKGEKAMNIKQKAAAAFTAALAASAPLGAANGDEYQFIITPGYDADVASAAGSSSASSATASLTSGTLAGSVVYAAELEARYRTMGESAARSLRSDEFKGTIISFK